MMSILCRIIGHRYTRLLVFRPLPGNPGAVLVACSRCGVIIR